MSLQPPPLLFFFNHSKILPTLSREKVQDGIETAFYDLTLRRLLSQAAAEATNSFTELQMRLRWEFLFPDAFF